MENREMVNMPGQTNTPYGLTDSSNTVIQLLNDLITMNRGVTRTYDTAVARLNDETNITLLQEYARQHRANVTELSNLVVKLGGKPTTAAGGGSFVRRAWIALKAAVTEGEGPILSAAAHDAENMLGAYAAAMRQALPEEVRDVIRQQLSTARLAHEKLSALSTATNS